MNENAKAYVGYEPLNSQAKTCKIQIYNGFKGGSYGAGQ